MSVNEEPAARRNERSALDAGIQSNPFIKDRKPIGLFTRYPSTAACRVVFTDGNATEVPEPGKSIAGSLIKHTEVVFIWMQPRRISFALSEGIRTAGALPVSASIGIIATPKSDADSLRDLAIHFDEKFDIIRAITHATIRERCLQTRPEDLRPLELELTASLLSRLNERSGLHSIPLLITEVTSVALTCEDSNHAIHAGTMSSLQHASDLAAAKHSLELLAIGLRESAIRRSDQVAAATSEALIEGERLKWLKSLEGMTPQMLIVARENRPEIARMLAEMERASLSERGTLGALVLDYLPKLLEATRELRTASPAVNMYTQK